MTPPPAPIEGLTPNQQREFEEILTRHGREDNLESDIRELIEEDFTLELLKEYDTHWGSKEDFNAHSLIRLDKRGIKPEIAGEALRRGAETCNEIIRNTTAYKQETQGGKLSAEEIDYLYLQGYEATQITPWMDKVADTDTIMLLVKKFPQELPLIENLVTARTQNRVSANIEKVLEDLIANNRLRQVEPYLVPLMEKGRWPDRDADGTLSEQLTRAEEAGISFEKFIETYTQYRHLHSQGIISYLQLSERLPEISGELVNNQLLTQLAELTDRYGERGRINPLTVEEIVRKVPQLAEYSNNDKVLLLVNNIEPAAVNQLKETLGNVRTETLIRLIEIYGIQGAGQGNAVLQSVAEFNEAHPTLDIINLLTEANGKEIVEDLQKQYANSPQTIDESVLQLLNLRNGPHKSLNGENGPDYLNLEVTRGDGKPRWDTLKGYLPLCDRVNERQLGSLLTNSVNANVFETLLALDRTQMFEDVVQLSKTLPLGGKRTYVVGFLMMNPTATIDLALTSWELMTTGKSTIYETLTFEKQIERAGILGVTKPRSFIGKGADIQAIKQSPQYLALDQAQREALDNALQTQRNVKEHISGLILNSETMLKMPAILDPNWSGHTTLNHALGDLNEDINNLLKGEAGTVKINETAYWIWPKVTQVEEAALREGFGYLTNHENKETLIRAVRETQWQIRKAKYTQGKAHLEEYLLLSPNMPYAYMEELAKDIDIDLLKALLKVKPGLTTKQASGFGRGVKKYPRDHGPSGAGNRTKKITDIYLLGFMKENPELPVEYAIIAWEQGLTTKDIGWVNKRKLAKKLESLEGSLWLKDFKNIGGVQIAGPSMTSEEYLEAVTGGITTKTLESSTTTGATTLQSAEQQVETLKEQYGTYISEFDTYFQMPALMDKQFAPLNTFIEKLVNFQDTHQAAIAGRASAESALQLANECQVAFETAIFEATQLGLNYLNNDTHKRGQMLSELSTLSTLQAIIEDGANEAEVQTAKLRMEERLGKMADLLGGPKALEERLAIESPKQESGVRIKTPTPVANRNTPGR